MTLIKTDNRKNYKRLYNCFVRLFTFITSNIIRKTGTYRNGTSNKKEMIGQEKKIIMNHRTNIQRHKDDKVNIFKRLIPELRHKIITTNIFNP